MTDRIPGDPDPLVPDELYALGDGRRHREWRSPIFGHARHRRHTYGLPVVVAAFAAGAVLGFLARGVGL